jgi:hypothetical protein
MLFNDVDKSKPHTVLMVTEPVRLACLSFAGLARGVYYIEGDFRCKIAKMHDKRLLQAGLIALRFISDTEKPDDFVKSEEIRQAVAVAASTDTSIRVEVIQTPVEPSIISEPQMVVAKPLEVVYEQIQNVPSGTFIATEQTGFPTETPAVPTEQVTLSDQDPIVILDTPPKRRGRKPKQVNVVAPAEGEAKLTEHEQDRRSAEPVPAPPAEDSIPNENSQALA